MATRLRQQFDMLKAAKIDVDAFEIGNEYDWICFNGDVPDGAEPTEQEFKNAVRAYAHILETAAQIIREPKYFPHSKIVTFGIAHSGDPKHSFNGAEFVALLKNLDGVNYLKNEKYHVDGIGTHIYCLPDRIATTLTRRLRDDAKVIGTGIPFWITEYGVGESDKYPSKQGQTQRQAVQEFYDALDECRDVPVAAAFYYPYETLATAPGEFTPAGEVLHARTNFVYRDKSMTEGDSTHSDGEWNEFLHVPHKLLSAKHTYQIQFNYKEISGEPDASFYALLRSASNSSESTSLYKLPTELGKSGIFKFSVSTKEIDDFELIIGIHRRGKIQVHNILFTKQPKAPE